MKPLRALLQDLEVLSIDGDEDRLVKHVSIDSRQVEQSGMFIAIRGTLTDGHKFIDNAVQKGAEVVVCSVLPEARSQGVTWVLVEDPAYAAGVIAHAFYGRPTERMQVIGVTGTNGKTTVATLLCNLLREMGFESGLISTVAYRIGSEELPATHTTPDQVTLNRLCAQMAGRGCKYVCMEVSSHALAQQRVAGMRFAGGIFTNISHDHLDYHGDFSNYLNTKKKFFDGLGTHAFALINADDPRANVMVQNTQAKVSKYSLHKVADFKARVLDNQIIGLHLQIDDVEMMSRLVGTFNAYNLLAVYGAARLLGLEKQRVITILSGLDPVDGRFDVIYQPESGVSAIVDYAHTPDALQKVMGTLQQLKTRDMHVIVVVGCGGDRDREKRPLMARIATTMSDTAILTSDNPRTEDPDRILDDMEKGVPAGMKKRVLRVVNRKEAIRTAVRIAGSGDVILIAGKGHEHYQEIHGERFPFNDKEIVHDALFEDI